MIPAFLTTLFFSVSGVTATRTTRYLPGLEANFWRLLLATVMLAIYAHGWGAGVGGAGFGWFLVSGLVGFGVGDIALYQAYPRLGSRLVILIVHCVASPLAAGIEWLWLGVPLTAGEMLASSLILMGVAAALYPDRKGVAIPPVTSRGLSARTVGLVCSLIAATGQGVGAVLSRRAHETALEAGQSIDGISAAYQRILAGLALSALSVAWIRRRTLARWLGLTTSEEVPDGFTGRRGKAVPWLVVNAIAGPALGVSCFQWALTQRGTGVVLPIVALTPLTIIPLAMWLEGERPSRRSLAGGAIAVAGAMIHALTHIRVAGH